MSVATEKVSAGKAHTRYRLQDGTLVPGVTTVLGVLNKPALVPWANALGLRGIDSRTYVDALATIGTLANQMIEHDLGAPAPDMALYSAEQADKAENALLKWYEWRKAHVIEPLVFGDRLAVELPLVSEASHYGGTIDCCAMIDGAWTVLDIKTSKAIYPEHMHQVAAYCRLLSDNGFTPEAVRVLQVGRTEDEGFSEHTLPISRLEPHWRIFDACLTIYRTQADLKREVG